jgi:TolB protein
LAYIGGDGNVYVTTSDLQERLAVTVDATVAAEGNGRSYHRLAWSPDGQLAFAAVERHFGRTSSAIYVNRPGESTRQISHNDEHFVIYLHWSPRPCDHLSACRRMAYLIEGVEAIDLRLVQFDATTVEDRAIGSAQPFYFSWSPDGGTMLWHRSGSRKFHPDASLTLYDVASATSVSLEEPPGYFHAPAWSITGEHWLDVVPGETGAALRLVDAHTQDASVLAESDNDIAFVWSPESQHIAYATRGNADDPFLGPIFLYDITTGVVQRVTDVGLRVQAFFWSPDGKRIGYIHWLGLPGESWAQWRVYNLITGQDRGYNAFNPSFHMRMLIGSFNQYAQSHRLWSPDGRYLTYADRDRRLVERVWLVDTWAEKGAAPILVDEGVIGVWEWE